jgi:hypothetical protein
MPWLCFGLAMNAKTAHPVKASHIGQLRVAGSAAYFEAQRLFRAGHPFYVTAPLNRSADPDILYRWYPEVRPE